MQKLCKLIKLELLEELKSKYFFVNCLKYIQVNFQKVLSVQNQTKKLNIYFYCIEDFLLRSIQIKEKLILKLVNKMDLLIF